MAKAGVFMGIICAVVIGGSWLPDGSVVTGHSSRVLSCRRDDVLQIAGAEVGLRETGSNDGKRVREYLAYTGIKVPAAWCAAYVSFVFHKAGYDQPKTAWSPALFPVSRIIKEPNPADVFGIWFPELKRIAHVGFVERLQGDFVYTLEGNTNAEGNREGQGVYRRIRHKRTVSKFADWIISNN